MKYTKVPKGITTILCDLDDTLVKSIWPRKGIGKNIEPTLKLIRRAHKRGFRVFLYSSRHWDDYENIKKWIKDNELPVENVILGKPLGYIIDDKAYNLNCKHCIEKLKLIGKIDK